MSLKFLYLVSLVFKTLEDAYYKILVFLATSESLILKNGKSFYDNSLYPLTDSIK